MKQVFASGKGEITVIDVPGPGRMKGAILVKNAFSVISSGTEGAEVSKRSGALGIYEQARASREKVDKVWELVKSQGVRNAYNKVQDKLEDLKPMGYTSAGIVLEVDDQSLPFKVGDKVALMGAGIANHAEYATVPVNLAAKVPDNTPMESAAFAALGCIAIQGIRRLEAAPGERIGVIGLGLIGQLTVRLLVAMGFDAYGMDLNEHRAGLADSVDGVKAWSSDSVDSVSLIENITNGIGLDGVIVTAATKSHHPVNLAFDLCRKRAAVSIVGDVGLGLNRSKMYRKELELKLSCSYGPGRYDPNYEIMGQDYPVGYVRWTEKRNLELFLNLISKGRLDLNPLITDKFPIDEAKAAYQLIKSGNDDVFAAVFDYKTQPDEIGTIPKKKILYKENVSPIKGRINVGVIGVGDHAKETHLPNLKKLSKMFSIGGFASGSGSSAGVAAKKYSARVATSDYKEIINDPDIHAVIIATRHSSHARMTIEALEAGKHVFVEKPPALNLEDCERIEDLAKDNNLIVRVGFNRRFSPFLNSMLSAVGDRGPRIFIARVNPGPIGDHWSNTHKEGGRILGEGVHFFDLCNWFMGSEPISISATYMGDVSLTNPNMSFTANFEDGSIGQVIYTTSGSKEMGKERFEAFGNRKAAMSSEYQQFEAHGAKVSLGMGKSGNKGHKEELEEFGAAIKGESYPIKAAGPREGKVAVWMALASLESAEKGSVIKLDI